MNFLNHYDLAVAWNWEYDRDFVQHVIVSACEKNISVLEIMHENVEEIFALVQNKKIFFRHILDRASDEDDLFQPLAWHVLEQFRSGKQCTTRPINPHDLQIHAADKATMHLEFLAQNIEVPYTIIVSPYSHCNEIELSLSELAKLGRPFIIKPANTTGGGLGVVLGAETLKEILEARQFHKNDKYLLQETITPMALAGRRAWFRVFYAFGDIIPSWWDDVTHIYSLIDENEEQQLSLGNLRKITACIQKVCQLDFFSTELVLTKDGRCVAVDYVNEMCDMRLQSRFSDGVPDALVQRIVTRMVEHCIYKEKHFILDAKIRRENGETT